jgi:hypothetical protein
MSIRGYVGVVERRFKAGGGLAHPLPAHHGSDVPLDKAKQQG